MPAHAASVAAGWQRYWVSALTYARVSRLPSAAGAEQVLVAAVALELEGLAQECDYSLSYR